MVKIMDRYFYSVELDHDGNKVVHMYGNIYWNDTDMTETDHRYAEWTFLYITLDELKELVENDEFFEYVNERVNYLGDITEKDAIETSDKFFNEHPGSMLHIKNVNEETVCGNYWFDV